MIVFLPCNLPNLLTSVFFVCQLIIKHGPSEVSMIVKIEEKKSTYLSGYLHLIFVAIPR